MGTTPRESSPPKDLIQSAVSSSPKRRRLPPQQRHRLPPQQRRRLPRQPTRTRSCSEGFDRFSSSYSPRFDRHQRKMFAIYGVKVYPEAEAEPTAVVVPPPLPNPRPNRPSRVARRKKRNHNYRAGRSLRKLVSGYLPSKDGEDPGLDMMGEDPGLDMMGEDPGLDMMVEDPGLDMMGEDPGLDMMGEDPGLDMMGEDPGLGKIATQFYNMSALDMMLSCDEDSNKTEILELLRFQSSKSGGELTCLKEYVTRMKESQSDIYYITGKSKIAVENSPFLERLKKMGLEVLFMVDATDGDSILHLKEFEGKKLFSVSNEGLELASTAEEKKRMEVLNKKFEGLCKVIKEVLADRVGKVIISDRMVDSPCCIVTGEDGWTTSGSSMGGDMCTKNTKIMEINPENAIIEELCKRADTDKSDKSVKDLVMLLFDVSLLTSGFTLDDPNALVTRIYRMLKLGLNIDDDDSDDDEMPALDDEMPPLKDD